MYDAAADKIFTSRARYTDPDKLPNGISEILWNESLKNGRKEYWREWIFAVDTEPTEAQKLHAEIHTYNGSVDGPWQADIPLRLIRKSQQ